jgi:hypothetical protein
VLSTTVPRERVLRDAPTLTLALLGALKASVSPRVPGVAVERCHQDTVLEAVIYSAALQPRVPLLRCTFVFIVEIIIQLALYPGIACIPNFSI